MILNILDWSFDVDVEATRDHTTQNAADHCTCGYCKNYYDTVSQTYPDLLSVLEQFGVNIHGPSELMPFEPTLLLACYRVQGKVIIWGNREILVQGVPLTPEYADDRSFFLWAGEMPLPWVQEIPEEDVVSPANLPEFLERMEEVWLLRYGNDGFMS